MNNVRSTTVNKTNNVVASCLNIKGSDMASVRHLESKSLHSNSSTANNKQVNDILFEEMTTFFMNSLRTPEREEAIDTLNGLFKGSTKLANGRSLSDQEKEQILSQLSTLIDSKNINPMLGELQDPSMRAKLIYGALEGIKNDDGDINQSVLFTCVSTTAENAIARLDPVKYVKFIVDLAKRGEAQFGGKEFFKLPEDINGILNDNRHFSINGTSFLDMRRISSKLVQSALSNVNGDYSATSEIVQHSGYAKAEPGLYSHETRKLFTKLTGKTYVSIYRERGEGISKGFVDDIDGAIRYNLGSNGLSKNPVMVSINMEGVLPSNVDGSHGNHAFEIYGVDNDGSILLKNPWDPKQHKLKEGQGFVLVDKEKGKEKGIYRISRDLFTEKVNFIIAEKAPIDLATGKSMWRGDEVGKWEDTVETGSVSYLLPASPENSFYVEKNDKVRDRESWRLESSDDSYLQMTEQKKSKQIASRFGFGLKVDKDSIRNWNQEKRGDGFPTLRTYKNKIS